MRWQEAKARMKRIDKMMRMLTDDAEAQEKKIQLLKSETEHLMNDIAAVYRELTAEDFDEEPLENW